MDRSPYGFKWLRIVAVASLTLAPAGLLTAGPAAALDTPGATPVAGGPVASALATRLGRAHPAAQAYAARSYAPIWLSADGRPGREAAALVTALARAGDHALPAGRYDAAALNLQARSLVPGDTAAAARLELALTDAFLAYGADLSSGVVDPRSADRLIYRERRRPLPSMMLRGLVEARDPAAYLDGLAPQSREYDLLRQRYAVLSRTNWGPTVPSGATLKPGGRSAQVPALRARLAAMGLMDPVTASTADRTLLASNDVVRDVVRVGAGGGSRVYDPALVEAVKRFQSQHGLNQDGVVGPATLAAINVSPQFRARQIAVNLERIRWLNFDLGRRHVMVNLADFRVALLENGRETFHSRTVVGKPRHATPEFSDVMEHMVINPTWYVPTSIAQNEILPKERANPGYMSARNMRMNANGRITQGPGRNNALGRVKFMFPNNHAIYLHDTPQRSLFERDVRTFSHGCIRVHKPYEFAAILLAPQVSDPAGTFQRWVDSGRERYVHLDEHLPVHITYRTAWVDEAGGNQFRGDVYGRDDRVAAALERAGVEIAGS